MNPFKPTMAVIDGIEILVLALMLAALVFWGVIMSSLLFNQFAEFPS